MKQLPVWVNAPWRPRGVLRLAECGGWSRRFRNSVSTCRSWTEPADKAPQPLSDIRGFRNGTAWNLLRKVAPSFWRLGRSGSTNGDGGGLYRRRWERRLDEANA